VVMGVAVAAQEAKYCWGSPERALARLAKKDVKVRERPIKAIPRQVKNRPFKRIQGS